METNDLIPAEDFCHYYNVETSFINSLEHSGLIKITSIEHTQFLPLYEIRKLEKIIRLHYDLDINVEGIETIFHLLEKIETMQEEIRVLSNKFN
ncbi:MAG: chaperone modulator CbpM [Bacteroidetes bacterium]|nr:chaperone modulator CbpM [Bacteroidota bacterium]